MNFALENTPPSQDMLESEREHVSDQIRHIAGRDTLITFILIIITSLLTGLIVFWSTGDVAYAGFSAAIFPILGLVLTVTGITRGAGFRSAALRLTDLKNDLVALSPVSADSMEDIEELCTKYPMVDTYQQQVKTSGRLPVNGELAMYWGFDASTQAKTARGRAYLDRARETVDP